MSRCWVSNQVPLALFSTHAALVPSPFTTITTTIEQEFLTEAEFNEDDFEEADQEENEDAASLWGYDDEEEGEIYGRAHKDEDDDEGDLFALEDDDLISPTGAE